MKSLRVVVLAVLAVALGAGGAAPASAAKPALATPQIVSVVAVDTRTATVSWTPVKGADHYVLEWAPAMRLSTSATTATVTDLYPGDNVTFTVRAETRRNAPSGNSDHAYVSLAPEGPFGPSAYALSADTVKIWWGSGIGCASYELATVLVDGSYSAPLAPTFVHDAQMWEVHQDPGTTASYAARCASLSGVWSTWSSATSVTTPQL